MCACGHGLGWHDVPSQRCSRMGCDCECFAVPGSLNDILGVWAAQGPFPLRNTSDVALFVGEILRLRAGLREILDIHQPQWVSDAAKAAGREPWVCELCGVADGSWPCSTRMVVDQALGGEQ